MEHKLQNIVRQLWIVQYRRNLTAYDTFNEDTFEGPTQETQATYSFFTEADALKFYEGRKAMLKFAGGPGDYYTYPTTFDLPEPDPKRTVILECESEDQQFYSVACHAQKAVCPTCDGEGTTLCDPLRGVAFSPEQMHDDPDFRENYFGGAYDVACDQCSGNKIVLEADPEFFNALPETIREDFERKISNDRRHEAEVESERRYFSRGQE